jgi:hypothetical protein
MHRFVTALAVTTNVAALACTVGTPDSGQASAVGQDGGGTRELVRVDNTPDLVPNIGRNHIDLVLLGGMP